MGETHVVTHPGTPMFLCILYREQDLLEYHKSPFAYTRSFILVSINTQVLKVVKTNRKKYKFQNFFISSE